MKTWGYVKSLEFFFIGPIGIHLKWPVLVIAWKGKNYGYNFRTDKVLKWETCWNVSENRTVTTYSEN